MMSAYSVSGKGMWRPLKFIVFYTYQVKSIPYTTGVLVLLAESLSGHCERPDLCLPDTVGSTPISKVIAFSDSNKDPTVPVGYDQAELSTSGMVVSCDEHGTPLLQVSH